MNRRDLITLLGGAAATWPLAARAQQSACYGRSWDRTDRLRKAKDPDVKVHTDATLTRARC